VRIIVHNCHTKQHRTVLTIFPLILQTVIVARMLSTGGELNNSFCDCECTAVLQCVL